MKVGINKGKHWKGALGLSQEIAQQLLILNGVVYSSAISACYKRKGWVLALSFQQEMVHQLLKLNVVSLSAVGSACEKGKQWEGTLALP